MSGDDDDVWFDDSDALAWTTGNFHISPPNSNLKRSVVLADEKWTNEATTPAVQTTIPSRCCDLTEGIYTWLGCISVTIFFLGVATVKFLG